MQFEKIVYAGHSAVLLSSSEATIGIDPWLEGNPSCPKELINPERLDLIVLTHGHSDHAGDAVRLGKQYGCRIIAIWELAMLLGREGLDQSRIVPMNKGGSFTWNGVTVTLTHALHSSSFETSQGMAYAGDACGVIVRDGRHTIYHPGDTALFSDMRLLAESYAPDLAFLPMGDHFTMGPREAAKAAELLGCKKIIPMHYATFDILTGTTAQFEKACRERGLDAEIVVLKPGEKYEIR